MIDLPITHKATLTQVKESKARKQTKLKSIFKPIIQKIRYVFKDKPIHLNLPKNGRRQINFIPKIKPMKWE
jgi:2,3-bisphosphoglycerate-independent phosphoglycerate mutase